MTQNFFPTPNKKSINEQELTILEYWKEKQIFQNSIDTRNPNYSFRFFDGPPFATGLPHYGHILAGSIKDAIPRYKTMQGYRVNRKWGWDCHGVPVEFLVEKEHQIGGKPGIEKMGVGPFNELCRGAVQRCANDWKQTVSRMGRFVDFEDDYKTMDPEFMESVWWVFGELWNKGLIYEGEKVVAYSPKLGSPLSNFEANLNYQNIQNDKTITAKFKIIGEENTSFLAWTTTPWTLPSNLALCVNPKLEYVKVKGGLYVDKNGGKRVLKAPCEISDMKKNKEVPQIKSASNEFFIVAKNLSEKIFGAEAEILETIKGKDLVGKKYEPLFNFFADTPNAFTVLGDEYVSDSDGTGIVHQAPNFGEDDARICHENGIQYLSPNPIDENGYFNHESLPKDLNGRYFRNDPEVNGSKELNANDWVLANLGDKIFERGQSTHSYPHCWRTDCALMYRGINTWFVDVSKIKALMVEKNLEVNWIPSHLKEGRFGKLLESAPDWAISRNRFWGCPIPVWKCSVTGKTQVVTSKKQLEDLSGKKVDDLHKHFVDDLKWQSPFDKNGTMERIEEVLDCWFESGAMPYASNHYPFKNINLEQKKNQLFAVRHGESTKNTPIQLSVGSIEASKKYPLTEKGILDAQLEAKKFESQFDVIVSSPLLRAQQTAKEFLKINPNAEYIEAEDLKDTNVGKFEGQPISIEWKWRQENNFTINDEFPGGGESYLQMKFRVEKCIKEFNQKFSGKRILFVSHGWPIDSILEKNEGKSAEMLDDCCAHTTVFPLKNLHFPSQDFAPADFIAEGIDQTRGWFYSLHVLGCALFGKNMYQNVITNGIILAEDGQKMSKSKQNYPDPNLVFEKYGADAMRFYLLSSPVVRGENFRFAEHGVAEVLKSVILPLKSAYQFFSTYANLDGWKPTRFTFVRHGEGDHNVEKIYSGNPENKHNLTNEGKKQIEEIAEFLPKFEVMIASPFKRTLQTATIIKELQQFSGDIITDSRVQEPYFGELEGKSWIHPIDRYKNKTTEGPFEVQKRIDDFLQEMSQKFKGRSIFVASHGSPIRNADCYQSNITDLEEMMRVPYTKTGKYKTIFALPNTNNELDKWILSELQSVVQHFTTEFDAYNIEIALRPIAPFIDNLNNWYLRRNRRRFWANGLDEDKQMGYETLHLVLLTLSKLLAPVCPFFAEKMFQDLGGSGSVHLEVMPKARKDWIDSDLEKQVSVSREIVALAAGIRARAKIKLRQPLSNLQFLTTEKVELDMEVIKAEANVKEVKILTEKELSVFATKIIRVNARMVGKKFGKKVQELIKAGKAGEFEILANGQAKVAGEILESDEFEIAFLTQEGIEAEATTRTVVLLETEISKYLAVEGLARELIRMIQDLRKSNGFDVSDRINISYQTESEMIEASFSQFGEKIKSETLAKNLAKISIESEFIKIDEELVKILVEKI